MEISTKKIVIKIAEDFYTMLYNRLDTGNNFVDRYNETPEQPVPKVTVGEVKRALKGMKRNKAAGEDGLTIDWIIDGGDFITVKLAELYTKCLQECSIPTAWKD